MRIAVTFHRCHRAEFYHVCFEPLRGAAYCHGVR